jgi:hypothetical protein
MDMTSTETYDNVTDFECIRRASPDRRAAASNDVGRGQPSQESARLFGAAMSEDIE